MATYYRWRKSNPIPVENNTWESLSGSTIYVSENKPNIVLMGSNEYRWQYMDYSAKYEAEDYYPPTEPFPAEDLVGKYLAGALATTDSIYYAESTPSITFDSSNGVKFVIYGLKKITLSEGPGNFISYVYSASAATYPNGGIQDGYYYDQRTTITSPTAPTNLQYPNPITTPTVTVSWDAATSNVPGVPISYYKVAYRVNPPYESMPEWYSENITATSYELQIPAGTAQIKIWVYAYDSNGNSAFITNGYVPVYLAPTLTAPSLAMQNQPITVTWTAIEGAASYTLQRKANTDEDWAQVYSGPNLTFTETAGAWSSVQYRVQATFSTGTGGWATSGSIPVISASALVISGSDGDLGTLVNDVPYTISTDTGNQITVKTTVNGAVIFSGEVESGAAKAIPVLDLVNGEGTIVIEASVETSSGTVSAVRTWTYNKALIIFPNSGGPAQLTKEGKIIFPKTLAECVRLPGGRTLDKIMGFPCQIFVGSYTGTGTYGDGDPNEVTVPFKPQIVFVSNGSVGTTIPMIRPLLKAESSAALTVAWTDDGVSWSATSAANQMNAKGTEYMVVAFG